MDHIEHWISKWCSLFCTQHGTVDTPRFESSSWNKRIYSNWRNDFVCVYVFWSGNGRWEWRWGERGEEVILLLTWAKLKRRRLAALMPSNNKSSSFGITALFTKHSFFRFLSLHSLWFSMWHGSMYRAPAQHISAVFPLRGRVLMSILFVVVGIHWNWVFAMWCKNVYSHITDTLDVKQKSNYV